MTLAAATATCAAAATQCAGSTHGQDAQCREPQGEYRSLNEADANDDETQHCKERARKGIKEAGAASLLRLCFQWWMAS